MNLNVQNFDQLNEQQAAAIAASGSPITDFSEGGFTRAYIEANSSVALWLQSEFLQVLAATRLATSTGSDVDSFVEDYNLSRLPAVAANGNCTFMRYSTGGTALLMPGTTVTTLDASQSYAVGINTANVHWNNTLGGYLLNPGAASVTVPVIAVIPGSDGNVLAGTIGLISSQCPFDTVTNNNAFSNGQDAQSDAALKAQFANYVQTRALSTQAAIEYAALSVQSGLSCYVQENINTAGQFQPGYFTVTVDDGSGNPSAALLAQVYTAVNNARGFTINFGVQGPNEVFASIVLTITVAQGYTKSVIQPLVETAIVTFVNALPVGAPLPFSVLSSLAYGVSPGVINVTGISLNNSTNDLGGGATQVVRIGSVVVN